MADPASGSTDPSWLTDVGNFMSSPAGQLTGAGIAGGVGLYEAGKASSQAKQLAGQIGAAGAPAGATGAGIYSQLSGGPTMGGPLGTGITAATGAANTLAGTAQKYGTGQLTPAQQQQVDQYRAASRAAVASQLGNRADSSTAIMANQTIDNNAAMLAESLVSQNTQIATGALSAVNQTYTSLLTSALNASHLGLAATSEAVQTQIQSDQQIAQYIQQIIGGIAGGLATAQGGAPGQTTPGGQTGGLIGQAVKGFMGGGGNVAQQWTPQASYGGVPASEQAGFLTDLQSNLPSTSPFADSPNTGTAVPDISSMVSSDWTGDPLSS